MAKGIRVNLLAKELGVESKAILAKLKDEGLADKAPNHMSTLPLGLAESVREWFSGHGASDGGGTAVETAPPVEVATKPKVSRSKKKKVDETEAPAEDSSQVAEPALAEPPLPPAPIPEPQPVIKAPPLVAEPEAPATVEPAAPAAPEPVVAKKSNRISPSPLAPESLPSAPPAAPTASPSIAATIAPPTPKQPGPQGPGQAPSTGQGGDFPRPARPTITLANRGGAPPVPDRRAVVQAPQLQKLEPAKIQGPRVVRIEKAEVVDNRGPRGPRPPAGAPDPTITPAGPRGGRGVKVSDDDDEEAKKKAAGKKGGSLSSRRRGVDGRRGEAMEKLKEFTDADLLERQERLAAAASYRGGVDNHLRKTEQRGTHAQAKTTVQKGEPVEIEEPITVRALSTALGVKTNDIMGKLMKQGVFATINQALSAEAAQAIALEYSIELVIKRQPTLEEQLMAEIEARAADSDKLQSRPPVVTILGHVDHGKTSLLDKIRHANVAAGEAGGITQHTAAWMVQLGEKRVTFIDTPGHQAFTSMRARGANMTDVVVLVVSAAEGVQPQTIESINHARAAEVPIVVAMNKIDRADANEQQVLGQLAANGLNPVEWGGDTEVIRTSAVSGRGIPDLIEILDYQSELLELKADPNSAARGIVIESQMNPGLGAVATVLVQDGTLHVGDILLSGPGYGRIRSLVNDRGEMIQSAGPATPVIVSGLDQLPSAGDKFFVLDDMDRAHSIAEERRSQTRHTQLANRTQVTLNNLFDEIRAGEVKTINLIIKGDVQGSVETLSKTVTDANTSEVKVRVIHAAVGPINESDVELASASGAVVIGFHVVPDEAARAMAEQLRVEIRLYRVIYEIFDDLKKALSGLLEPEIREKLHGHAEIRQVFKVSRIGNIAGCMVTDGHIQRGSKLRLVRNGTVITQDLAIESLKRGKDDVKEVKSGFECGIKIAGYDDIKVQDVLEAYVRETFQRTL